MTSAIAGFGPLCNADCRTKSTQIIDTVLLASVSRRFRNSSRAFVQSLETWNRSSIRESQWTVRSIIGM
jgi:hypothetical protein